VSVQPPIDDISKNKMYALAMLLAALVAAAGQVAGVPPAWLNLWAQQETIAKTSATPAPTATPPPSQPSVCGTWASETSPRRYNFVCQGQGSFEIYELGDTGPNKTGSGVLTEDGVEADILSVPKNRKAHFKLRLSADGRKMEGTWKGKDPRESGQVMFRRV
jgi:hypothetical protein